MKSRIQVLVVGASVLALAAALYACGGEEALPEGTLTKKQFVKKATAICAQGDREAQKLDDAAWQKYQPDHVTHDKALLTKIYTALLPARERESRRLRAIGLPKGGEELIDEMITAGEEGIEEAKENPQYLYEGGAPKDFGLVRRFELATKYGLEDC